MATLINGRFLAKPPAGVTLVARELTRGLLAEVAALPPAERPALQIAVPDGAALPLPPGFAVEDHADWLRLIPGPKSVPQEQLLLPQLRKAERVLNFCNVAPVLASKLTVWIHDAQIFDSPDSYAPGFRLYSQAMSTALRLRRAEVATVSSYSKSRLLHYGFRDDQVTVVLNGGDHLQAATPAPAVLAANGLTPGGFAFMVGSRARHKNIPFAVRALLQHGPGHLQIAVAGLHQAGAYAGESLPADPRLRLLPRLSDGEMRALMQGAAFVLCPSLDEGFGLSAAEALWEEAPLGVSRRASLPEVAGEAALLFDPENPRDLGDTAHRLCQPDVRAMLKARAAQQKLRLTWARAARFTLRRFVQRSPVSIM